MGLFDRFKRNSTKDTKKSAFGIFGSKSATSNFAAGSQQPLTDIQPTPDFGGSRTSIPVFLNGGGGMFGAMPRRTQAQLGLDQRSFSSYTVNQLMDILVDAHPDLAFAVWNFMRMGNSGYTVTVTKPGTDKPFAPGEKDLKLMLSNFEMPSTVQFERSRSLDRVVNQLIYSTVLRGAASCEVVLAQGMQDVAFIAPVDPGITDFQYINGRFVPFQDNLKIALDIPTFFYEGLDEAFDDPLGRSPMVSSLHMIMFQLQVLNDIKAVVHNQGYPRLDIKIVEEVLLQRMPIQIRNNEQSKQTWLSERLSEIIKMYSSLNPDDAFVHFDSVEVGMTGESKAMIDPEKLMGVIDSMVMSGLKTLSTILGRRSTGNTESFAKIEIKLYLKGVEAIQKVVESVISRALTISLNIRGKQGVVKFKFNPLEIRTELEQAQFEQIALQNYAFMRDQGWIDQEEASMRAVRHAAVLPEPDWAHLQPTKNKDGQTPQGTPDTTGGDVPTP